MKQAVIFCITFLLISLQNICAQTPDSLEESRMMDEIKIVENTPMPENEPDIIGTSAPDFEVTDMNGNLISLKESVGKVMVLSFGFTACKHFVGAIPELNEVYEKYHNNSDLVFAAIFLSKKKDVIPFLEKYPISYPVVSYARETCDLFKVQAYPTIVVIDKNGKYFYHHSGNSPQIGEQVSMSIENALQEGN